MNIGAPEFLIWCALGVPWLVLAYILGRTIHKQEVAVATVILGLWLGPCAFIMLLAFLFANLRSIRHAHSDREMRVRESNDIHALRSGWDDDKLAIPELLQFAKLLETQQRNDEAIAVLERALERKPTEPELWRIKARLHWKLGQMADEAEATAKADSLRGA